MTKIHNLAYEEVCVVSPHVGVGRDVKGESFMGPQGSGVGLDEERRTLRMTQKTLHKICRRKRTAWYQRQRTRRVTAHELETLLEIGTGLN